MIDSAERIEEARAEGERWGCTFPDFANSEACDRCGRQIESTEEAEAHFQRRAEEAPLDISSDGPRPIAETVRDQEEPEPCSECVREDNERHARLGRSTLIYRADSCPIHAQAPEPPDPDEVLREAARLAVEAEDPARRIEGAELDDWGAGLLLTVTFPSGGTMALGSAEDFLGPDEAGCWTMGFYATPKAMEYGESEEIPTSPPIHDPLALLEWARPLIEARRSRPAFDREHLDALAAFLDLAEGLSEQGDAVGSQLRAIARGEPLEEQNPDALRWIAGEMLSAIAEWARSSDAEDLMAEAEGLDGEIRSFLDGGVR